MHDGEGFYVARLVECGESRLRAEDLTAFRSTDERAGTAEAKTLLADLLAAGPQEQAKLEQEVAAAGISAHRMRRAGDGLGVEKTRQGFGSGGKWIWALPGRGDDASPIDGNGRPDDAVARRSAIYGQTALQSQN